MAEGSVEVLIPLDHAADHLKSEVVDGDWLNIGEIGITPPNGGAETTVHLENKWDAKPEILHYFPKVPALGTLRDRDWLRRETMDAWQSPPPRVAG